MSDIPPLVPGPTPPAPGPAVSPPPAPRRYPGFDPAPAYGAARPQAFDYVIEVAIPLAVFGLLGSLLYYLIDVYAAATGVDDGALRWVSFWFLMGVILITRIRSHYGDALLSWPYIAGLGLAVGWFIFHFTMYSGSLVRLGNGGQWSALLFNYGLILLIWWAAGTLTRQVTSGEALAAAGEEGLWSRLKRATATPSATPRPARQEQPQRRPRHPAWGVMWSSAAALILFGVGQSTLAGASSTRNRHALECMLAFAFFALVLLALTSLSSLRSAVQERRIRLSRTVTATWIIASGLLVLLALLLASVLPHPKLPEHFRQRMSELPGWVRHPPETPLTESPAHGLRNPRESAGGQHPAERADQQTQEDGQSTEGTQPEGKQQDNTSSNTARKPDQKSEQQAGGTKGNAQQQRPGDEGSHQGQKGGKQTTAGGEAPGGKPDQRKTDAGGPGQNSTGSKQGAGSKGKGGGDSRSDANQKGEGAQAGTRQDEQQKSKGSGQPSSQSSNASGGGKGEEQKDRSAAGDSKGAGGGTDQTKTEEGGGSGVGQAPKPNDDQGQQKTTGGKKEGKQTGGGIPLWLILLILLLLLLLALIAYLIYRWLKNPENRAWLSRMWSMLPESVRQTLGRAWAWCVALWERFLGLFRRRRRKPKDGEAVELPEDPFYDIFADRRLREGLTPAQIVRHVYAAFQAFCGLIGHPRSDQQTPYEFLRVLPDYLGGMEPQDARRVTNCYVVAAYSPREVGPAEVEVAQGIWERMQGPIDTALSAQPARA